MKPSQIPGFHPAAAGMFLFGHLSGMAVLNGYIQSRSGLPIEQFGLILATGALAALAVNLILRWSGRTLPGALGLLLLAFAVWLPVLAQSLPALLLAYSLQGAASRIALAGLYRAVAAIQRSSVELGGSANTTLLLESMAGFGLCESFVLNSVLTESTGHAGRAATTCLLLGIPLGIWMRDRLPDWKDQPAVAGAKTVVTEAGVSVAFVAYCAEVFTMTQATAWSSILIKKLHFGDVSLSPLLAAGLLSGTFWMVVGIVRYTVGTFKKIDLRRIVFLGSILCVAAVLGVLSSGENAVSMLVCYALLGAGIACFVPFALQTISRSSRAGLYADRMALLGPVMSVGVHVITGYFAEQRELFVLGALSGTSILLMTKKIPAHKTT